MFLFYYTTYIYKYINKYHFVFVIYEAYFYPGLIFFLSFSIFFSPAFLALYCFVCMCFICVLLFNTSLFLLSPYLFSLLLVI